MVQITMKYILLIIQMSLTFSTSIFTKYHIPSCKNCIFFKKSISFPEFYQRSYCTKFGYKTNGIIKVEYDRAIDCRSDENKCGIRGNCFHERRIFKNVLEHDIKPIIHKTIAFICVMASVIKLFIRKYTF
jgi:hypothetical protein